MKKILSLILALTFVTQSAMAVCPKPVTYLEEGKPTQCTGYLFSPEAEAKARTAVQGYEKYLKISQSQDELIVVMDKRLALQTDINTNLKAQIENNESANTFTKILSFGLGVLVTGVVFYIAERK